ncbi:MAG: AbiH family protein [Acholeplasmataceae bacterium]
MPDHANTLLIIGNGFDLECGLPTSFEEFNKKRKKTQIYIDLIEFVKGTQKDLNKILNTHKNLIVQKGFSIFEFYLIAKNLSGKEKWFQIEKFLYNSFTIKRFSDIVATTKFTLWEKVFDSLGHYKKGFMINVDRNDLSSILAFYIYNYSKIFDLTYIKDNKTWNQFLLSELNIFENLYCAYLKESIDNTDYNIKANDLFEKLVPEKFRMNTNILSFNYTYADIVEKDFYDNVHGKYFNSDVIIGIDIKDINQETNEYIFTKTYRKVRNLIAKTSKIESKAIVDSVEQIIFYGHSLNEQDYSYFQSIFDYYDIYHSNIKIIFKYKIFDQDKEKEIIDYLTDSIYLLFESYGKTFDNIKIGKNLFYKLINEQRLVLDRIY